MKSDVYLFTAKEAGGTSNTSDGNSFEFHADGGGAGKFGFPVSSARQQISLNLGNGFSWLSTLPKAV